MYSARLLQTWPGGARHFCIKVLISLRNDVSAGDREFVFLFEWSPYIFINALMRSFSCQAIASASEIG